jgi:pimeloyl-ACP methyl ester carboxylesterase
MRSLVVAILSVALLAGCSLGGVYSGEFFFVKTNGEYLPVWVRGNTSSNTFVVFLQGGPGISSMNVFQEFQPLQDLESNYAFVYWDQRNSGSAQGSYDQGPLTIAQFTDDTDSVVNVIRSQYHDPQIVLFGWSWGGALGTAYLLDPQRQSKIAGWIEMDGAHNTVLGFQLSRQFVLNYAATVLNDSSASASQRDYWQSAIDWYKKNPTINNSNVLTHAEYVKSARGYFPKDAQPYAINNWEMYFGPYDFFAELMNWNKTVHTIDLTQIDYSPEMSSITVPTLVLWGAKDGVLPYPMAQDALSHIGSSNKTLVEFPNSGHGPVPQDFGLMKSSIEAFLASL